MPPIRSLVFKHYAYIIVVIFLLGEIMPIYSCYIKRSWFILQLQLFLITNLFLALSIQS